ncbi:MAG: PDGLE domain-containing protein [Methanothrix sp.]|nr:PDGLE domain-containing protein [Methanothrix sp.]
MDKTIKKLAIGLMLLVILTPLGLFAVGETFGEWGPEEVKEKLGFVPPGLERLSSFWSAPLPDYAFSGGDGSMTAAAAAYILSAVIGVVVCGGLLYFIGKKVAKD